MTETKLKFELDRVELQRNCLQFDCMMISYRLERAEELLRQVMQNATLPFDLRERIKEFLR